MIAPLSPPCHSKQRVSPEQACLPRWHAPRTAAMTADFPTFDFP
jgi:hypothetical protein